MASNKNAITWLQIVTQVSAVLVSLGALFVALNVEERSYERFQKQLEQSEKIAKANIRPLLTITTHKLFNSRSIVVENNGVGTAVITNAVFKRGLDEANNFADIVRGIQQFCGYFYHFGKGQYIPAQSKIKLIEVNKPTLMDKCNIAEEGIGAYFDEFDQKLAEVIIEIEYEDIMGFKQQSIVRGLAD